MYIFTPYFKLFLIMVAIVIIYLYFKKITNNKTNRDKYERN